jgi:hypothetical protein
MIGPPKHPVPSSSGDVLRSSDGFHTQRVGQEAVIFPGDVVEVHRPTTDVTDKVGAGDGAGTGARKVEP